MLSISIVVYTLDRDLLSKTIESLVNSVEDLPATWKIENVDIIDNGNNEEELAIVINEFTHKPLTFNYYSTDRNLGYGKAHNLSINKSLAKYHLILNPDVIISSPSIYTGLKYLDDNTDAVAVAPSAIDRIGNIQYLAKSYPSLTALLLRAVDIQFLNRVFNKTLQDYEIREIISADNVAEVQIISGCFMLCRTDSLKKIGGFDTRYFLYFEDFALSMALQSTGKLYYLPSMKIVHFGGNSAKKGLDHIRMFISSMIKFFNQYGWKLY